MACIIRWNPGYVFSEDKAFYAFRIIRLFLPARNAKQIGMENYNFIWGCERFISKHLKFWNIVRHWITNWSKYCFELSLNECCEDQNRHSCLKEIIEAVLLYNWCMDIYGKYICDGLVLEFRPISCWKVSKWEKENLLLQGNILKIFQ